MASCGHSTASKNIDVVEVYSTESWEYSYFSKMKWTGYRIGDFGFRSIMEMFDAYFDFMGGVVCALTGVPEDWAPGENPKGRGRGNRYRFFQLDHHHPTYEQNKLLSLRGFIHPEENKFLAHLEKRGITPTEKIYRDYLTNPPFQRFLRKVNPKEYKELVNMTGRYDPRWA